MFPFSFLFLIFFSPPGKLKILKYFVFLFFIKYWKFAQNEKLRFVLRAILLGRKMFSEKLLPAVLISLKSVYWSNLKFV